MLEKNLSASQRDQVYLNLARDELKLKQSMVDELTEATRQSNNAFEQMSKSIESVGKSIGDGLALMANALWQHQNYPQQHPGNAQFNQNYQYHQGISVPTHHSMNYQAHASVQRSSEATEQMTYENL